MNYQELQEAKQTFRLHTLEKDYKPFYKDRKEFVRRFSPKKIASMTIDEYVEGKQSKNSFCYLLERKLKPLGSISGINSSIFGVWYSAEQQGYKFDSRFGNDYKEAYKLIKSSIIKLIEAGKLRDYDVIISNPLNSLVKGKILSIYYPDKYLNIFSKNHLDYYLKSFDLDTAELMKQNVVYKRDALLAFKDSDKDMKKWSIDMFAVFLHSHYPKSPAKARHQGTGTCLIEMFEVRYLMINIDPNRSNVVGILVLPNVYPFH